MLLQQLLCLSYSVHLVAHFMPQRILSVVTVDIDVVTVVDSAIADIVVTRVSLPLGTCDASSSLFLAPSLFASPYSGCHNFREGNPSGT